MEDTRKTYYFTFGSDEHFPYQNTFLIVIAESLSSAIEKFRAKYPDRSKNCVNCAFWYTQEQMEECKKRGTWYKGEPAEVIE